MLVFVIIILFLFWPSDVFAWGPGTHLEVATGLLKETAIFSPVVAGLLKKYRDQFVYGMVSADVLMGKKYVGYLHHNHNWSVGRQVYKNCKTERERASAYGYLAHLASDIVAHNYYIPYMIINSFDTKMKQHTYWELRFDNHVHEETWNEVLRVIRADVHDFDSVLESTLKRPMFSFRTNKRIFNTILLVQRFRQLRRMVDLHSRVTQWPLKMSEVRYYKNLIMETTRDFMKDPKGAPCLSGDPAGHVRLKYANDTRKTLKKYVSRGLISRKEADKFIKRIRRELRKHMFDPAAKLPGSYEVM
jgi:hypothetical protein